MNRRLKLLWVVIGILATLALVVMTGGCAKNATVTTTAATTKVVATVTTTMPSPSPSITTSAAPAPAPGGGPAAGAPPAGGAPPPGGAPPAGGAAASPKPPAPGGAPPPPPGGGAPPPPPGGGAPPPPPGGGAPPPPPGGGAPPPPPGGGAPPPPAGGAPPPPAGGAPPPPPGGAAAAPAPPSMSGKMVLTSPVVKEGGSLGDAYTCNGVTSGTFAVPKSPPLTWTGAPAGTKSFVVILSGIRGGGDEGIMLLVYNIPGTATGLPEGLPNNLVDPKIGTIGSTDRGVIGYTPPCGGSAGPWLKTFTLYALSTTPEVFDDPKFVTAPAIRDSMKKITLDAAQLNFNVVIK